VALATAILERFLSIFPDQLFNERTHNTHRNRREVWHSASQGNNLGARSNRKEGADLTWFHMSGAMGVPLLKILRRVSLKALSLSHPGILP
jgi:hypothetical protein